MNPTDLEKSLNKGELDPIYLFLAEEPYWTHRLTEALRRALKKRGEFEDIRFEGNEWILDQLLSEFGAYSMFAGHRLIRVLEGEKIKKSEWPKVAQALKGENQSFTAVFIFQKKDGFKEAVKVLGSSALSVECLKPKARDVPAMAVEFAKEEGKLLSLSDAKVLIEMMGNDLLTLRNQIALLSIFVGDQRNLAREEIQKLISDTAEKESFALTRALSDRDRAAAFSLVRALVDQGEAPVRLLALLARHFRLLLKSKLLLKRGEGPSGIASALRIPPFVVDQYLMQARGLGWKQLIQIYRELSFTDRALKSSPLPPAALLEKFIGNCFG